MVRGAIGERPQRSHIDLTLEGFAAVAGQARAGYLVAMMAMDLRAAGAVIGKVPDPDPRRHPRHPHPAALAPASWRRASPAPSSR